MLEILLFLDAVGRNTQANSLNGANEPTWSKQGVCHIVALPFRLKRISRQKRNYENSNIPLCKNIIFKKSSKRNQNPSRYYNSVTKLKSQHKPKHHLSKILI
jgi:hypothetical protein